MVTKKNHQKSRGWGNIVRLTLGWLILVGASVIAAQLIIGHIMLFILGSETLNTPVYTAVYSALSYILALALIIGLPKTLEKLRRKKIGSGKKSKTETFWQKVGIVGWPTWTDIGLAVAGFIIYILVAALLTTIFNQFPWFDAGEVQEVGFNTYAVGFDRLVAFATLVIIAPVAEEMIFRGVLYGKLRNKFSEKTSNLVSIIISSLLVSLLFGLVHMQWNVGVNVFAMSLVLCAMREVTGTIHAGILTHMIKNGVAFYLLFVLGIG